MDINRAFYFLGHDRDRFYDATDEVGHLVGIALCLVEQEIGLESDEIDLMGIDILTKLCSVVLACERIWVVVIGQKKYLDAHASCKEHIGSSQGCFLSCSITIVKEGDVVGEPMQDAYLVFAESGT